MADVLGDLRKDLEKRLKELAPMVEEHAHVQAALDALKGAGARTRRTATTAARSATTAARSATTAARSATTAARSATTAVRRSPASKNGATAARGRPRGSGARAQEVLRHVHANPGITIAEIAKRMKIKPNYLYRILPNLAKDGKVRKDGKGYHAAETAPADGGETPKSSRSRARRT
jgi:Winged helix-turn-helix DNA-binding